MPDTTTTDDSSIIDSLLGQALAQPRTAAATPASSAGSGGSFIGLLGSALGGGTSSAIPMSAAEKDEAGQRALMNFGLNMLANSGYSSQPRSFGQILAQGMAGAQESLGRSQEVTAASRAAQQEGAKEQQAMQLARIKEALPLLNLRDEMRRAKAAQGLLAGTPPLNIGAAGAGGAGTGGATASADVPPELMPAYQAASQETGIPVAVLIAKDKQESGFNNSKVGGAKELGIAQIHPDTAAAPGFGVAPISQADLGDPGKNIMFGARYLAGRAKAAGVTDWSDPAQVDKALLAYNGGGDKDYVAHVRRYLPGAAASSSPGAAPASSAAAPGAPGAPKLSPAATATAAPDVAATGTRFAGPGVPAAAPEAGGSVAEQPGNQALLNRLTALGGTPPPAEPTPSPGATPAAEAIKAGMIARGADPATLAAGPGVPGAGGTQEAAVAAPKTDVPAQTGGLVVPPGVTPPPGVTTTPAPPVTPYPDIKTGDGLIKHPGTPAEFRALNYEPPPKTEDFNPNLTADQQRKFAIEQAGVERDKKLALTASYKDQPAKIQAALDRETALNVAIQDAMQDKRAKADAKLTEWNRKQSEDADKLYAPALQNYATAAQSKLAGEIESQKTDQTNRLARENKVWERLDKDQIDSRATASNLDGLLALSNNIKNPSIWATMPFGGSTLLNWATKLGMVSPDEAGGTQLLQSGIANTVARMRSGMSMGQLSDRDLTFIESMAPNMFQNQETRAAVISYLRRAQDQIPRFNSEVNKLMSKPGMNISDAMDQAAQKLERDIPIVPIRPADIEAHWTDNAPEWADKRKKWAQDHNIRPGTMFRRQDGGLEITYSPTNPPPSVKVPQ